MRKLTAQTSPSDTWHQHFDVPVIHQKALNELLFDIPSRAVHSIPRGEERTLDFYAQLGESDYLFVSLHGAAPRGTHRYPMFRRVESMKNRVTSLLSFADPTLAYSDAEDFTIGWYVGSRDWDPLVDIARIVRNAQQLTGARRVMFVGGSAGGHAALRIAVNFPGSLAFVTDPQTDIGAYYASHRSRLLRYCWPGKQESEVLRLYPDRFDMTYFYPKKDPKNFIYYRQSTGDEWHERVHARPFEQAVRGTSGAKSGRLKFVYEQGERDGHGKITEAEFNRHFEKAVAFWDHGTQNTEFSDVQADPISPTMNLFWDMP